jgi:formylmethanofuran dehydrogenase subunit B
LVADPLETATRFPDRDVHRDIVCPFCKGGCDDVQITIEDASRIVAVAGGCERARLGFGTDSTKIEPVALIDQQSAALDEAVTRAANILAKARSPLFFGLEHLTCEAQSLAVSLADRLGAIIDTPSSALASSRGTPLQQVGESSCTLGDLRDRADFVLLWDVFTCFVPCPFCELLIDAPASGFFGRGRTDQSVVIVDELRRRSASESLTDEAAIKQRASALLAIREQSSFEAVWVLRALVKGLLLDPDSVLQQTGLPLAQWNELAEQMTQCRYGVIAWSAYDPRVERALSQWIVELNNRGRFAGLSLNKWGMNSVGAEQVLAWRTGYPCAVSFAGGFPRYSPAEHSAGAVLERGEADAAVLFGCANDVVLDDLQKLAKRRSIVVIANEPDELINPGIFIRTAQPGFHSAGTIFRFDGVPLPLRKIIDSPLPAVEEVLKSLLAKLGPSQQITPLTL